MINHHNPMPLFCVQITRLALGALFIVAGLGVSLPMQAQSSVPIPPDQAGVSGTGNKTTQLFEIEERSELYRVAEGVELQMHLYLPAGKATAPRAGIVFFFGGGWTTGGAGHFRWQARHLASLGMVAACADYRIKSKHGTTPFDALRDAKAAVRWMRGNAERLGVDPEKIVASGGSAGAHLAACTAMIKGFEEDVAEDARGISSIPNALVLFDPVLDATRIAFRNDKSTGKGQKAVSPAHHVRPGLPPTLVLQGDADKVVPYRIAERFAQEMNETGNVCRLVTYPGRDHAFYGYKKGVNDAKTEAFWDTLRETEAFLRERDFLTASGKP